jgi:Domain of unknown function (DUF1918)
MADRKPRSEEAEMKVAAGDKIIVESEKVGQSERRGIIEEVLELDPPRLRVHWDDGHTTVLTPSAGAARVVPTKI